MIKSNWAKLRIQHKKGEEKSGAEQRRKGKERNGTERKGREGKGRNRCLCKRKGQQRMVKQSETTSLKKGHDVGIRIPRAKLKT